MTTDRVLRGGSWILDVRHVRCARRYDYDQDNRNAIFGFRPVAKAIPPDSLRVLRGGSWILYAQYVRCAYRRASEPGFRLTFSGLRPVAKANL
jgi:formylglycine-generating enzyme required for sulfatase activity